VIPWWQAGHDLEVTLSKAERRLAAIKKAECALEHHLQGQTWEQAAKAAGYSCARSACAAVTKYLASHPTEGVEELRKIEDQHLLMLRREAWKNFRTVQFMTSARGLVEDADGLPVVDHSHKDKVLNTLLRISESRRRLLGLDQPVRVAIESQDEDDALLAELDAYIEDSLRHRDVPVPDGMVVVERDPTGYPVSLDPAADQAPGR
jgi:hypothetical protein